MRRAVCEAVWSRDTRNGKTLAVVVAIDKTDDLAKAGFLGEPDFTPSDRQANLNSTKHSNVLCVLCQGKKFECCSAYFSSRECELVHQYCVTYKGVLLPICNCIHCVTCCAISIDLLLWP